jgi:DNA-binding XRE family transcriptional regulator
VKATEYEEMMNRLTIYDEDTDTFDLINPNTPIEVVINALGKYENEEDFLSFGETLARMRRMKGLNQSELGAELGLSQTAVSYYERGLRLPCPILLERLTMFFSSDKLLNAYEREHFKNINKLRKTFQRKGMRI